MATELVRHWDDSNFEREVLHDGRGITVVDFWAEWCGPCRMMTPTIEALAKSLQGEAVVGKVNVDQSPMLASHYSIQSIPTILIFVDGHLRERMAGVQSKGTIENAVHALSEISEAV